MSRELCALRPAGAMAQAPTRTATGQPVCMAAARSLSAPRIRGPGAAGWNHRVAVHFDGHAAAKELDGQDQEPAVRPRPDEDAFDAAQRSVGDPDPLPLFEIRMAHHRERSIDDALDGLDLGARDRLETIPSFAENPDEPLGLHDLDVAALVDAVLHEEIAWKH